MSSCKVCGEGGHMSSKCPELRSDLNEGIVPSNGGYHDHDGDCEDSISCDRMTVERQNSQGDEYLSTQPRMDLCTPNTPSNEVAQEVLSQV